VARNAVDGFVGIAGPYDIAQHYEFERRRGVHEARSLQPRAAQHAAMRWA
jgi:hypothetical protein